MKRLFYILPVFAFVALACVLYLSLRPAPLATMRSALIGKPAPALTLQGLGGPGIAPSDLAAPGKVTLVNVFASWCIPCRTEAAQLAELTRRGIPVDGIAVRDREQDLAAFLSTYGDPFRAIGGDVDRRVQLSIGSAGVPETFVIDGHGIIRHQHIGEITDADLPEIMAAYQEAAR